GFHARAAEVDQALREVSTSFVLVTTAESDTIRTTIDFHRELTQEGFHVAGVIANRVYDFPPVGALTNNTYPEPLRRKLLATYEDSAALAERDGGAFARLQETGGIPLLAQLPVFAEPPTSLASLRRFSDLLT